MSTGPQDDSDDSTAIVPPDVIERTLRTPGQEDAVHTERGRVGRTTMEHDASRTLRDTVPGLGQGAATLDVFEVGLRDGGGDHGRLQEAAELGRGGMGRVLEAFDPALGRRVAVKVALTDDADALARFVLEAQITSQLEHPNIMPVYDAGLTERGAPWYAMQKVQGRTLTDVLRGLADGDDDPDEWSLARLLASFVQVCNAVDYAHDRGVLHRDLKPDNIMFGPFGEVLLLDWGVAKILEEDAPDVDALGTAPGAPVPVSVDQPSNFGTLVGSAVGTAGFMSPEAARGEWDRVGPHSDVFGLGCVLFNILTLTPPWPGESMLQILFAATRGDVPDPRERAPERAIDEELAGIVLRAMQQKIRLRTRTAGQLAHEVQDFLEGRQRRQKAIEQMGRGRRSWERWQALGTELEDTRARLDALEESTPPWTPRDQKAELLRVRQAVVDLDAERTQRFSDAINALELALSHDPSHRPAHDLMADAAWTAFLAAEESGDRQAKAVWRARVQAHDDGRYTDALTGDGRLVLTTEPPGAQVICERYERRGLVWPLTDRQTLGTTPLDVPLPMGSYRLRLLRPGSTVVTYPVHITRGRRWDSSVVVLPPMDSIPPGQAFVAAGPFTRGGDADAQDGELRAEVCLPSYVAMCLPVTTLEYAAYLTDLHRSDPELAWARSPRNPSGTGAGGQYWTRPGPGGRYEVPEVDADGDRWDERWPVMGVCWEDAVAYADWFARRTGLPWRLPDEAEWEKMARGVDERLYPWGDGFDATLCNMRDSLPDRPVPLRAGAYPTDVSVYGVRDVAGGQIEFCGDRHYGGNERLRPTRGGSWTSDGMRCRVTWRTGYRPGVVRTVAGFRLVRSI